MAERRTRQLAAIMFADMVGYTALMQEDEERARAQRDRQREVLSAAVPRHHGEILQHFGDGTLAVFNSAVDAIECAVEIQFEVRKQPEVPLRIGIHTGDIVHDQDGVYGDGVNVASRIEGLSSAGGIMISGKVFDEIKNHPSLWAVPLGRVRLKNVMDPVEVYAITNAGLTVPSEDEVRSRAGGGTRARVSAKRVSLAVLGLAAAGLAALTLWSNARQGASNSWAESSGGVLDERPSVAVLPFENLSPDEENAYFASGLHDEVMTQLLRIAGLRVISRTSVMEYARDRPNVRVIAENLGVSHVTEATVQRLGDRLRVNVQLIDARTDARIWAQRYDRELSDAFEVQSDIARMVAEALETNLTVEERGTISVPPTTSPEAYRFYLQGRDYVLRPGYRRENFLAAQRLYERAIELDPRFALAHAELSRVHGFIYWERYDVSPERLEAQRREAEEAVRLQPDLPQAHVAAGWVHYVVGDHAAALDEYTQASRGLPNDAEIVGRIGYTQRRLGNWGEVFEAFERATALNPRSATLFYDLGGHSFAATRRYEEAVRAYDRALTLAPDLHDAAIRKGEMYVHWRGELDTLRAVIAGLPPDLHLPEVDIARLDLALWERDAEGLLALLGSVRRPVLETQVTYRPTSLYEGWAHRLRGDVANAEAAFESARATLEPLVGEGPDDGRHLAALAFAYAGLGRQEDVVRTVERFQGSGPRADIPGAGAQRTEAVARIYAQADLPGEAVRTLEALFSGTSSLSVHTIRLDPFFDPIRADPRFQALLERYDSAGEG